MKRLNVNIPDDTYRLLKLRAAMDEVTMSELVSIWVSAYLHNKKRCQSCAGSSLEELENCGC